MDNIRRLSAEAVDSVSDGSSDSGKSAFSSDSLKEALEDLQMDTCLLDLEPLLSDPIVLAEREPVRPDECETWHPTQVYCDKISARFPEADECLIQRLGNANYYRYLRCQEARNRMQSAGVLSNDVVKDIHDGASSKFHDSGIGSSLPTTYADTVMSYGDNDVRKVRLPPLPALAKDGVPFACLCCGKMVSVRTNSAWKQHIYADLQPWVCLEIGCPKACETFDTRKDWVSHLALDHEVESDSRMSITCPLCRHDTGSGKDLVTMHLSSHLEEISLGALPVDCNFEEEGVPSKLQSLTSFSEVRGPEIGPSASHIPSPLLAAFANHQEALRSTIWAAGAEYPRDKRWTQIMENFKAAQDMGQKMQKWRHAHSVTEFDVQEERLRKFLGMRPGSINDMSMSQAETAHSSNTSSPVATEAHDTSLYIPLAAKSRLPETKGPEKEGEIVLSRHRNLKTTPLEPPDQTIWRVRSLGAKHEISSHDRNSGATQSDTVEDKHNNSRGCYCKRGPFGDVVVCGGRKCKIKWFHMGCVGLKGPPPIAGKWICDDCKAIDSSSLRIPLDRPDHRTIEKYKQIKALIRDFPQENVSLGTGGVHNWRSAELYQGALEKVELAASPGEITIKRHDGLTTSEHTNNQATDLARDGPINMRDIGRRVNFANWPGCESSQAESARRMGPQFGYPKEFDETLPSLSHTGAGFLGVSQQRSQYLNLRPQKIRPFIGLGCKTCRARRMRCDGERPVCSNCSRSKRSCEQYPPPPPHQSEEAESGADTRK